MSCHAYFSDLLMCESSDQELWLVQKALPVREFVSIDVSVAFMRMFFDN